MLDVMIQIQEGGFSRISTYGSGILETPERMFGLEILGSARVSWLVPWHAKQEKQETEQRPIFAATTMRQETIPGIYWGLSHANFANVMSSTIVLWKGKLASQSL